MDRRTQSPEYETNDSRGEPGSGHTGGGTGAPAFQISQPEPSPVPILIAVPHAGRIYPAGVIEKMRDPARSVLRLEDRYVDLLAAKVAQATGAALLQAHAPRAMIDLNRGLEEMDWTMVSGGQTAAASGRSQKREPGQMARRARSGLGLVPRRLTGQGEIWRSLLTHAELSRRVAEIHEPYHAALNAAMDRLTRRWGAALLIDFHSMPPLESKSGAPAAKLVIGDRFGASCDSALVAAAFAEADGVGLMAAHNRPYAGGYVLDRHGKPRRGRHALQFEICRASYLDDRLAEPGPGLDLMTQMITGVVRRLAAETAALGGEQSFAQAAE